MKHTIVIDDSDKAAKHLLSYVRNIAKTNEHVSMPNLDIEEMEDLILGKLMEQDIKSGILNKKAKHAFLKEIGLR